MWAKAARPVKPPTGLTGALGAATLDRHLNGEL